MKIVHLILNGILTDGFAYQDNLLTKYHKRMGHEVTAITSEYIYNQGKIVKTTKTDYCDDNGVHVIRLQIKNNKPFSYKFKKYNALYETLERENPDCLFIHGVSFIDIKTVRNYLKKHNNVVTYVDNHSDKSNSGTNFISYNILHKFIWRHYAKMIKPYVKKFYGVMPARLEWLKNVYNLPTEKCDLLVMGADDEYVEKYNTKENIRKVRKELNIDDKNILIVTGGKIDLAKKQTLLLMKAISKINNCNIKLCVFGSVVDELKDEFDELCNNENIIYLGWASNEESYKYLSIADLVVFPGRHSVYWEIAVALGKPLICKNWEGTNHVDIGGNVVFLYDDTIDEIMTKVISIVDKNKLKEMKIEAMKNEKDEFLYSNIAKKSISDFRKE